ncbi:hypothetical protein TIFTF001_008898 [Ficus carica]|uniref:Uncharacterized protein n=1 Tax=Ficus carica TaxID=3494 RepID=A0AA88A5U2_FICCA|nr:hypothetical protein TIFTF001_008898 [Ficus carica]
MCLAASKQGWPHCRPVIMVDGSILKARFGGILLAACSHDADGSIFPLAFGTRESLAIVADRHKGIEYASNIVYPDADFETCIQYLAANLKMSNFDNDFEELMCSTSLCLQSRPTNQFEYTVTNKAAQTSIVDLRERNCTCRCFQDVSKDVRFQVVNSHKTKRGLERPRDTKILS